MHNSVLHYTDFVVNSDFSPLLRNPNKSQGCLAVILKELVWLDTFCELYMDNKLCLLHAYSMYIDGVSTCACK